MSSTVYDVKVRYSLDDKASSGTKKLAGEMDRAGKSAFSLRGAIAGLGLASVFVAGKKALIDFNSEIDQMRIGMTTIMVMQLKKPWDDASKSADKLFSKFQEMAKKSPATTKDFITMANALTPTIASLGGGEDKIEKLTQGAVLASLATGTRADVGARDVQSMLTGNVKSVDLMAKQLLASKGIDSETWNKMDVAKRGAMTEELLSSPALMKAADEFGKSFAGTVSTFQDQLQMALGTVGKPLMASMTSEVAKWNTWIEKHPKTIARISAQLGGMIRESFEFIGKTVGWLVEHRDTLFLIGKTFLVFKGASLATNAFKGFAEGIRGFVGQMSSAKTLFGQAVGVGGGGLLGSFKSLGAIITGAGGVLPAFSALAFAVFEFGGMMKGINDGEAARGRRMDFSEAIGELGPATKRLGELNKKWFMEGSARTDKDPRRRGIDTVSGINADRLKEERKQLLAKFADPTIMGPIMKSISEAREKHGLSSLRDIDIEKDLPIIGRQGVDAEEFDKLFADNKNAKSLINELGSTYLMFHGLSMDQKLEVFKHAFPEQFGKPAEVMPTENPATAWKDPTSGAATKVNVTIHRIEVAADDPDRFVFGMVRAFKNAASNPTQAASAIGD